MNLKIVRKSINGKSLAVRIEKFTTEAITEILEDIDVNWNGRDWFVELADSFMYDLAIERKITQWDIMCDTRNNKLSNLENGILYVTISFQQTDCVNTTQLLYTITK